MAGKRGAEVENSDFAAFIGRTIRAYRRRIGAGDLEALTDLVALSRQLDEATAEAVTQLRTGDRQASWAEIGAVLGCTRQNAQKRFGGAEAAGARKVGGQPGHLR